MAAVEEQQRKFTRFSDKFGKRLAYHLNNLFIQQVKQYYSNVLNILIVHPV